MLQFITSNDMINSITNALLEFTIQQIFSDEQPAEIQVQTVMYLMKTVLYCFEHQNEQPIQITNLILTRYVMAGHYIFNEKYSISKSDIIKQQYKLVLEYCCKTSFDNLAAALLQTF